MPDFDAPVVTPSTGAYALPAFGTSLSLFFPFSPLLPQPVANTRTQANRTVVIRAIMGFVSAEVDKTKGRPHGAVGLLQ